MTGPTRRDFLKSAAAAGLATSFTVAGTSASARVLGANDRLRIGVCGLNGRGQSHAGAYSGMKDVELAYVIGHRHPVSLTVDSFGTGTLDDGALGDLVAACFDMSPAGIIESLDLRRPIYAPTAVYGHFGRPDRDFPWERLDRVEELRALAAGRKPGRARSKGGK